MNLHIEINSGILFHKNLNQKFKKLILKQRRSEFYILEILIVSGLVIYIVNFLIGWFLKFKIISIAKSVHQFFFISIIINLILIIIFVKTPLTEKIICALSLSTMFMLPFGRKGGLFHIITSSIGLSMYIVFFLITF